MQPKPATRTGQRTAERAKYMTWSRGDLDEADQELLRRAGINTEGRTVFKFLPPEIEAQLATLERQFKNRASKDIRRDALWRQTGRAEIRLLRHRSDVLLKRLSWLARVQAEFPSFSPSEFVTGTPSW